MNAQITQGFFQRLIKGSLSLWQAFWIVFVFSQVVLYALYALFLYISIFLEDQSKSLTTHSQLLAMVAAYTTAGMFLTALISRYVWKCTPNSEQVFFSSLARIVIASYLVLYGVKVMIVWSFVIF